MKDAPSHLDSLLIIFFEFSTITVSGKNVRGYSAFREETWDLKEYLLLVIRF